MSSSDAPSELFPHAIVLLVLLPPADSAAAQAFVRAALHTLQQQLGAAIRVLRVDEATHPDVVRSFHGRGLPAWVLMRHGVELWRQPGLPIDPDAIAMILSKMVLPPGGEAK